VDVTQVLVHLVVVLLAAKAAAEASERVGIPAVVGEILVGVLIGPSVLGLVGPDEVLRFLGELGVILLLLDVGMEMDLRELAAVGRASLTVATVGVVVPFLGGIGVGLAFDMSGNETLFVAAALTATSVGVTARVFGDLRALASVEARTVLGAAVADDVMGLVILTVVIRVVSEGSVSLASLAWILVVAIGFLVLTTLVGVAVVPPLFGRLDRHSRSTGTLVAVALAFTLALAVLADAAKLAPIVGAFVAGLILGRCRPADRIRREMAPVGHLLIPVFFLQIGIDADVAEFIHTNVLRLAAVLLAVAVVGKLASAAGLWGSPGDKTLVGIGMIPRGEVGLVFATVGLSTGVFGQDVYAALLLVVLATTLLTPPLLRRRLRRVRAAHHPAGAAASTEPPGGWLRNAEGSIELVSEPAPGLRLEVALDAALTCAEARAGASLLSWLSALPPGPLRWTLPARDLLIALLERGSPRSWRLLVMSGVLERALPELGAAVAERRSESELDPIAALHWPRLAHLQEDGLHRYRGRPEKLLAAALVLDATDESSADPTRVARELAQRLGLGDADERSLVGVVSDAGLLVAASRRIDGLTEEPVLQLAAHLVTREQAEALYALTLSGAQELDARDRTRTSTLHDLVLAALAHPELVGRVTSDTVEQRRREVARLVTDQDGLERVEHAPRRYLLATAPADLARQVVLCDPVPRHAAVRAHVTARPDGWTVDVVARDRPGLLAWETGVLADHGLDVVSAIAATWGDGCALASFVVRGTSEPDRERLQDDLALALRRPITSPPVLGVTLEFDDSGSPWHTLATVRGKDRPGLLHALTAAFAAAGADVHAARAHTTGGEVVDVFELTDVRGSKLSPDAYQQVEWMLARGVVERPRRPLQRPGLTASARRRLRASPTSF
jgi:Kef-type K+ transport system membrane component KefB/predicted amino acid-binding ACT domain protein